MQLPKGFKQEELTAEQVRNLREVARQVRGDVLKMIRVVGEGHPAGCLSCAETLVTLYAAANVRPSDPDDPKRDRIVLSPPHLTAALYATLGRFDFVDRDDAVSLFAKAGSVFEGAPNRAIPGVEWTGGVPGAGLAAACGFALAGRVAGAKNQVFVVMSDGEQQRGIVAEARRFAKRNRLNQITALMDANGVVATGKAAEAYLQSIKYEYIADGWDVIEVNGHDPDDIYRAIRRAIQIQSAPVLVVARTTSGYGVSFMENDPKYHEVRFSEDEYQEAMRELRLEPALEEEREYRTAFGEFDLSTEDEPEDAPVLELPEGGREYGAGEKVSGNEALAAVLHDVVEAQAASDTAGPVVLFEGMVAVGRGVVSLPKPKDRFFEVRGQHDTVALSLGAFSLSGGVPVWLARGTDALEGAFQSLRLDGINRTHVKLFAGGLGLDGGRRGRAGLCLDYVSLVENLPGWRLVFPADVNQLDRVARAVFAEPGNWVVGVWDRPTPVVLDADGKPLFGCGYTFEYGRVDVIRPGDSGVILTTGPLVLDAIEAWEALKERGMEPAVLHVPSPGALLEVEDPELLQHLRKGRVITYEDHNVRTGLGARVADVIATRGISCRLLAVGVEGVGMAGEAGEARRRLGLDAGALVARAAKFLKR
ncbi:transketolase C-terminal domain-containing protein [Deferrisoma sp.]